jgi:hypothetical protein
MMVNQNMVFLRQFMNKENLDRKEFTNIDYIVPYTFLRNVNL